MQKSVKASALKGKVPATLQATCSFEIKQVWALSLSLSPVEYNRKECNPPPPYFILVPKFL